VLQKAFFTAFGLRHSRYLLFVRSKSARFQPWGYQGPIVFGRDIPASGSSNAGIYVDWTIKMLTADEARVEISDWEGLLAASGQEITYASTAPNGSSSNSSARGSADDSSTSATRARSSTEPSSAQLTRRSAILSRHMTSRRCSGFGAPLPAETCRIS
jgi:hypothetical protein